MEESRSSLTAHPGRDVRRELNRLQERFQFMVDSLSEACFGLDFSWRYIFFNSTAEMLAGLKKEEVIGRDIRKVFPDISHTPIFQEYEKVMKGRAPRKVVGKLTLPSGKQGHFAINIIPIPEGLMCLVKEVDDITLALEELRESEAFLMALLDAPRDYAILVTNPQDQVIFVNDAAKNTFGYSRKDLSGQSIELLIPYKYWQGMVEMKGGEQEHEAWLTRKDGTRFPALMYSYPVHSRVGTLIARVSIVQDLTSQKEVESRRIQAARYQAIAELTKDVAHNFNNILGSIMGNAQLLQLNLMDFPQPKAQSLVHQILQAGKRMGKLVQDMLTFTGIMDSISLHPKMAGNLDAILRDAISFVQPALQRRMKEKNIRIHLHYQPGDYPTLDYLTENFRSAVVQILLNAVEAMDRDGAIELKAYWPVPGPRDKNQVMVEVRDQGRGMDQNTLKRAVEPLFSTKKKVGVGIGLTMAYGIVNRLGGSLQLESQPGQGTTVRVWLPAPGEGGP